MDVRLVLELLGQVLQALQAHELGQQPLLEALLGAQEAVPRALNVRDHLALGGDVGGAVGQAQLGLEGVEVGLQLGLLLDARRLVLAAVLAVLLQLLLDGHQRVARLAALQPGQGAADPLKELENPGNTKLTRALLTRL